MGKLRAIIVFTIALVFAVQLHVIAQVAKPGNIMSKKFSDNEQLEYVWINDDGNYAALTFEDQYWGISIDGAKTLWTRKLQDDYDYKTALMTWMSPTEIVIALDKELEWIDFPTGKSLGKVKLYGEGLEDLKVKDVTGTSWGAENHRVHRHGNVLFVPFSDGYALYDLKNKKELFHSEERLDEYRREFWGNTMLIHGSMDTAVLVDVTEPRVIYRHNMDGEKIDVTLYQTMVRYKDAALLMIKDNMLCVNAATGKRIGMLGIEPDECETYVPLIVNGTLHLLVQEEEKLKLCDISTGKTVWSLKKSTDVIGTMMEAWTLPNGDILMTSQNEDDEIFAIRLATSNGARKWQQRIAAAEHSFKSGHQFSPGLTFGKTVPSMRYWNNFTLDSTGVQTYYSQFGGEALKIHTDEEFMTLLSNGEVHEGAKAHSLCRYLGVINNELILSPIGRLRKAWDGKVSEEEDDGEGILKVDIETGKIKSAMAIPFVKNHETQKFDVYNHFKPDRIENGTVLFGTHTLVLIKKDGTIDTLGFSVEDDDEFAVMDFGSDYFTIKYETPEEKHIIWKVYVTPQGFKRELMGMSESDKYISVFFDTTHVPVTLRWFNDALEAFPVMSEIPKTWPKPLWRFSEDQLEKMDLGSLDVDYTRNDSRGIHPFKDVVYLLGENALGVIDAKTGCTKTLKWQGWQKSAAVKYDCELFTLMPGGVMFDMGSDIGIVKSGTGCTLDVIGYTDSQRADQVVVYTLKTSTVLVVDTDENTLNAYRITP